MVEFYGIDKPLKAKADASLSLDIVCVDHLQLHHYWTKRFQNSSQCELRSKHLQFTFFS